MSMSISTPDPTTPSRHRHGLTAAIAVAALALATACGGSTASTSGSAAPATAAAGAPTTAADPTTAAAATATAVTVTMTEFKFAMDDSAPKAGSYTLHVVNAGKYPHALELSGPGVSDQKTAVVQPGQSADLPVTLQPGSYDIWCPVDGHRAKGMEVHVTVAA